MTRLNRRSGVTLMEVLVAIMIMSVGMLAIMTLFPLGALNMARAIRQDRGTTHGVNSDSMFRYYWKQAWYDPATGAVRPTNYEAYGYSQEPMLFLLENHVAYPTIPSNSEQPSFAVLVDPVGWQTNVPGSANQAYVSGINVLPMRTTLRRCINLGTPVGTPLPWAPFPLQPVPLPPPVVVVPPPQPGLPYPSIIPVAIRLTTLLDDFSFDTAGEPAADSNQLQRGGQYNVSWLIQRKRNDVPHEVDVQVLVFAGRSPTDTPSAETAFPNATAYEGQKQIIVPLNGSSPPALRRGGWIAFSMPVQVSQNGVPSLYPSFDFYRVVAINDEIPDTLVIETEAPIKTYRDPSGAPLAQPYTGFAVVFDNLIEVFDRGTVSPSSVAAAGR